MARFYYIGGIPNEFSEKTVSFTRLRTFSASRAISDDLMGIRALFQASNGDIWVGTRWQELYRLDSNGHLKQVFSLGNVYHKWKIIRAIYGCLRKVTG